jgi:purine-nucleoside/S-methyl-5'-thioadenosine phosphorylase / adenosine deaminase
VTFEPSRVGGFRGWRASRGSVEVYFGGKGPRLELAATLGRVLPADVEPAWLRQVHSADVLDAEPGGNGDGDALVTSRRRLALAVVTADCVPVLLTGARWIAAVHAGWRGLAKGILGAAVERLADDGPLVAWIGPAIGPCCYEVGADVAREVGAASVPEVVHEGPRGRPHLDLVHAARVQLAERGVAEIHFVEACTRCRGADLWSYRRDGPGAGRNVAAVWRR